MTVLIFAVVDEKNCCAFPRAYPQKIHKNIHSHESFPIYYFSYIENNKNTLKTITNSYNCNNGTPFKSLFIKNSIYLQQEFQPYVSEHCPYLTTSTLSLNCLRLQIFKSTITKILRERIYKILIQTKDFCCF